MVKLLLIGPLKNKNNPLKIGGTVVLFERFLNDLREKKIEFEIIDTLKDNYSSSVAAFISIVYQLIKRIKKYDHVSLHATTNSFIMIGPIMIVLSNIFNKQVSMRKFAGNFREVYENSNIFKKILIKYVLKNSSMNFFETKYLVNYFSKFNKQTYWFPNVRLTKFIPNTPREYRKRYIYVGTINEEKGINELIEVVNMIDGDYIVDLYGPIIDEKYSKYFFKKQNINYKGSLISSDVIKIMDKYDVLILPSHREGYPGVIIEAFSLGIPSIATRLEGIMEMIEDRKNGLLIDVKNSKQLEKAIVEINEDNYLDLSRNALKSFHDYDSMVQTNLFLKRIELDV